jgi:hypothetical protein
MADTTDRTHPDHNWTGDSMGASNDDLAAAVEHLKAWFKQEMGKLAPATPAPVPTPEPVAPVVTKDG